MKGAKPNLKNTSNISALHLAASAGNVKHIVYLKSLGLNINTQDSEGNTPLHEAAQLCRYDAANLLIMYGANKYITNNKGEIPLDLASHSYKCEVNDKILLILK